jgi:hypothetical protein
MHCFLMSTQFLVTLAVPRMVCVVVSVKTTEAGGTTKMPGKTAAVSFTVSPVATVLGDAVTDVWLETFDGGGDE